MASSPNSLRPSLAAGLWLTTLILGAASPALAQAPTGQAQIAAAAQLYFEGKAVTARTALVQLLDSPDAREPAVRLGALETLLDICIASYAHDCVSAHAGAYGDAADPARRPERLRSAAYYFDAGRLALNRPEVTATILDWAPWKSEDPSDAEFHLRRQVLGARVALAQGKPALALSFLDNSLSLVASLQPDGADRYVVAQHLAQAIALLAEIGQTGRAYGLLTATGGFIGDTLPPRSVDAAAHAVTAGNLLALMGDVEAAERMLGRATPVLETIELDEPARDWLLGSALRLRVALAAPRGDAATARRLIDAHPFARLYARSGRTPETREEVAYLAARALVAAVERAPDPIALAALSGPNPIATDPAAGDDTAVLRAFGRLMLMPAGPERGRVLDDFGQKVRDQAVGSVGGVPGAWYRPSPIDTVLLALALSGADAKGADRGDLAFALFQLGSRFGPTFDSDALTALGAAKTEAERTAIHEALRLRARRDRLERTEIQKAVGRLQARPAPGGPAGHDPAARQVLLDLTSRIEAEERGLARTGAPLSGANVVALEKFQAALAPNEAALGVAISVGGLEYMCVRRDAASRFRRPTNHAQLLLDARLLRAGLTATHAPSETSDSQFPVEAAVRLYDDLIRPFESCLKPGDRIVWLPAVSAFALPIAALLPAAPPRLERGWDLAQADWLVKRHAISYPGSASMVVAARSGRRTASGGADFLGVGDPVLTGRTVAEEIAQLAQLPDTKEELEVSARGFRSARLLLQGEATERQVRGELATPYRYISFATHGLIRDDLQGLAEPALVLTPVSAADAANDGLLTATEIADLSLSARFVALSACNTANFDLTLMARDLPALASAFAVAGVPATLGTLWPVNTETGRLVVADTFTRLRTAPALGPADALAAAQRAFLAAPPGRPYLHPRFWAPFVILGDGGS